MSDKVGRPHTSTPTQDLRDLPVELGPREPNDVFEQRAVATKFHSVETQTEIPEVPKAFICPITLRLMRVPFITVDGHTCEHSAMQEWFAKGDISPHTGLKLENKSLIPNYALHGQIENWVKEHYGSWEKYFSVNKEEFENVGAAWRTAVVEASKPIQEARHVQDLLADLIAEKIRRNRGGILASAYCIAGGFYAAGGVTLWGGFTKNADLMVPAAVVFMLMFGAFHLVARMLEWADHRN